MPHAIDMGKVVYALLHDVGKVFVRAGWLMEEKQLKPPEHLADKLVKVLRDVFIREGFKALTARNHDELSRFVVQYIRDKAVSKEEMEELFKILRETDHLAAAERGVKVPRYSRIVEVLEEKLKKEDIGEKLKLGEKYKHYLVPLALPTWVLVLIEPRYIEHVGPTAYSQGRTVWDHRLVSKNAFSFFARILDPLEKNDVEKKDVLEKSVEEFIGRITETLKEVMDKPLWLPVLPLTKDNVLNIKAYRLRDIIGSPEYIRYVDILETLLDLLIAAKNIYKQLELRGSEFSPTRGFIETLDYIMKTTTLLVPSAVFMTILPDISLYAHSKLVAAYTAALQASENGRLRLLAIDANGIQEFVSASLKAAAASRMLRGRSLLINLALDALAQYALKLFGDLPSTNILVQQGGAVYIVIPDLDDLDKRIELLRKTAQDLQENELSYSLRFTIEVSEGFRDVSFVPSEGKKLFSDILEELDAKLQRRKFVQKTGLTLNSYELDALTQEPVKSNVPCNLVYQHAEGKEWYNQAIAGGKLEPGDVLSPASHIALVAGSVARNLVAIIALHIYEFDDGTLKPYPEVICGIARKLIDYLKARYGAQAERLFANVELPNNKVSIGLVPLPNVGTVYILLSWNKPQVVKPDDPLEVNTIWMFIDKLVFEPLANILPTILPGGAKQVDVYLRVQLVNFLTRFLPAGESAKQAVESLRTLLKEVGSLPGVTMDVSFGYTIYNAYHPADPEDPIRLADLDRYVIVGLVKMDVDNAGEVYKLLARWPSRFVTLSELMNLVLIGVTHLRITDKAAKGEPVEVISLYAGGDDAVMYGGWASVLIEAVETYKRVVETLYPLTMSMSYVLDKSDIPILDLYSRAVKLLEDVAKKVKASGALITPQPREDIVNGNPVYLEVMPVLPKEPWPSPTRSPTTAWCFKALAEVLKHLRENDAFRSEIAEVAASVHMLSIIAYQLQRLLAETKSLQKIPPDKRLEAEISYVYLWGRRGEELEKLLDALRGVITWTPKPLYHYPKDIKSTNDLINAIRILITAKPALDLILLMLRRGELATQ